MWRSSRVLGALLMVSLAPACHISENRYIHRTVRSEELVGSWTGTAFAMEFRRLGGV